MVQLFILPHPQSTKWLLLNRLIVFQGQSSVTKEVNGNNRINSQTMTESCYPSNIPPVLQTYHRLIELMTGWRRGLWVVIALLCDGVHKLSNKNVGMSYLGGGGAAGGGYNYHWSPSAAIVLADAPQDNRASCWQRTKVWQWQDRRVCKTQEAARRVGWSRGSLMLDRSSLTPSFPAHWGMMMRVPPPSRRLSSVMSPVLGVV